MSRANGLRQITIDATRYAWIVARIDPGHVVLRVWAAERKRRDYPLEVRLQHDDPWLSFGAIITGSPERVKEAFQLEPITPGVVRRVIEAATAAGWGPHHPPDPRLFEMDRDGVLAPTDDPRRVS